MNFLFGYLLARSMLAGPRRPAYYGSGKLIFGGLAMIIAGIVIVNWDTSPRPYGWFFVVAGIIMMLLGAVLDRAGVNDVRNGYDLGRYVPEYVPVSRGAKIAQAAFMTLLVVGITVVVFWLHVKGCI